MTIDLEEIYIAVLLRGCSLRVMSKEIMQGKLHYFIEITEENGVSYIATLWQNP